MSLPSEVGDLKAGRQKETQGHRETGYFEKEARVVVEMYH